MTKERRALVVDDDDTLRLVVKRQLAKLGWAVDLAATGKAAIDAFVEKGGYDLILMDVQMPELDGLEAAMEIRKWESVQKRGPTRIVAMTASQDKQRALDAGMNEFLFKPFVFADMQKVIERSS